MPAAIKRNPNKPKVEAAIKKLGHFPTPAEQRDLSKRYGCDARTIRRWAKRIHQPRKDAPQAPQESEDGSIPELDASDAPEPSTAAVDMSFDIEQGPVAPGSQPPLEEAHVSEMEASVGTPVVASFPIGPVIGGLIQVVNGRFTAGGIAPITPDEENALAAAWQPVSDLYLAPFLGRHGPLVGAAVVTLAVFGPRLMEAKAKQKDSASNEDAQAAAAIARAQDESRAAQAARDALPKPVATWVPPKDEAEEAQGAIAQAWGMR